MKKIMLILVAIFFIASLGSISFAAEKDFLEEQYKSDFMKLVDQYVTKDQQKTIITLREAYYAKIKDTADDAKQIRVLLRQKEDTGDLALNTDPALIESLKAALYEKESWLSKERQGFEQQCKAIAPNITRYILKMI